MDMFDQDGSLIIENMMYCKFNQANVIKDNCLSCLVKCNGENKKEYREKEDYFI
jgi:hypothetical protein